MFTFPSSNSPPSISKYFVLKKLLKILFLLFQYSFLKKVMTTFYVNKQYFHALNYFFPTIFISTLFFTLATNKRFTRSKYLILIISNAIACILFL